MTDDPTTNWDRRRDGAVGAVFGATLGPLGAAIGGATDGTRLALRLSVGADAAGDDAADAPAIDEDATTIEMPTRSPKRRRTTLTPTGPDERRRPFR